MLNIEKLNLERLCGGKKFRKTSFHWPWISHCCKLWSCCYVPPHQGKPAFVDVLWSTQEQLILAKVLPVCWQGRLAPGMTTEHSAPWQPSKALSPCCSLPTCCGQQANHSQEHTMARRHIMARRHTMARRQLRAHCITPLEDKSFGVSNYFATLQSSSSPAKRLLFRLWALPWCSGQQGHLPRSIKVPCTINC